MFGLGFVDAASEREVAVWLLDLVSGRNVPADGRLPVVVTPNVDMIVRLSRHESASADRVVAGADVVLPDGQPVVWASKLLGAPLTARISGSGVVQHLWPALVAAGLRVAAVVPNDEVRALALADDPDAAIVTAPMLRNADDCAAFGRTLAADPAFASAHVLFCNLGFPKQETVIEAFLGRCNGDTRPWCMAVGGSFEMYYGLKRRAPRWMQRSGLEWLHRFALEPRRLFRRYFIDDLAFAAVVWRERRDRQRQRQR